MTRSSEDGFGLVEFMIAASTLLVLLSGALYFFSRSQRLYSNERVTLDMVQDTRMAFDRITSEVRMAGAGLPANCGIVSGTATTLVIRGDFNNVTTVVFLVTATGVFRVGSTSGFSVGQTVSLLNPGTMSTSGQAALAKISALDPLTNTISLNSTDMLPLTSGAQMADFGPGTILNVIERRTYAVKVSGPEIGNITRAVAYDNTKTAGTAIQPEETIAANILTASGNPGLSFSYLKVNGLAADVDGSGQVTATQVSKVRIDLDARSANRDLENMGYRTLSLRSLVQVRSKNFSGL